jgi:hypothetical protein
MLGLIQSVNGVRFEHRVGDVFGAPGPFDRPSTCHENPSNFGRLSPRNASDSTARGERPVVAQTHDFVTA